MHDPWLELKLANEQCFYWENFSPSVILHTNSTAQSGLQLFSLRLGINQAWTTN